MQRYELEIYGYINFQKIYVKEVNESSVIAFYSQVDKPAICLFCFDILRLPSECTRRDESSCSLNLPWLSMLFIYIILLNWKSKVNIKEVRLQKYVWCINFLDINFNSETFCVMHFYKFAFICKHDRTVELLFEKYQAPALFLAKNDVFSCSYSLTSF